MVTADSSICKADSEEVDQTNENSWRYSLINNVRS